MVLKVVLAIVVLVGSLALWLFIVIRFDIGGHQRRISENKAAEATKQAWRNRHNRIKNISETLAKTEPDSKEEARVLAVLDEMNLSPEEWDWVRFHSHADYSDRTALRERKIRSLES